MNPGTTYPSSSFALLLTGHSGQGKSTVSMGFPRPWFCDLDRNLAGANAVREARGWPSGWSYDHVEVADDGKPVAPKDQWPRLTSLVKAACLDPNVGTIVMDSLPCIQTVLTNYLVSAGSQAEKPLTVGGETVMTMSLWNPFYKLLGGLIVGIRASGKPLVVTCHMAPLENEISGLVEYMPNVSGQWKSQLPRLFTDYWQCDTRTVTKSPTNKAGVEYFVRTAPTPRLALKCGVPSLIPEFVFDPSKVAFLATPTTTVDLAKV